MMGVGHGLGPLRALCVYLPLRYLGRLHLGLPNLLSPWCWGMLMSLGASGTPADPEAVGCMAGCFTLGSLVPLAEPSGLSPQTPAICKQHLPTVLLPQKPAPETPLPCSPSPGPALAHGEAAGPHSWPHSLRLLAGAGIWEVIRLAMVHLSSVRTDAHPYPLCFLLYISTRAEDGHFPSMSWKALASQVLPREAGTDLRSAWAAENLEMTNSYCRNAGILLELWVVSPECCALRTATVPQHHWAWFLKEKSCPREPGC